MLPLAADVAAGAFCVEAESFLLEGRTARAARPAMLARLLALQGSGDPLVFGVIEAMLGLKAWLLGNLGGSLRHLESAIRNFAEVSDFRRESEAWDRIAFVLEQAGLAPEAEVALARVRELEAREIARLSDELLLEESDFCSQYPTSVNPFSEHRT